MMLYFITGVIQGVGYNVIDIINERSLQMTYADLYALVCQGVVANAEKAVKGQIKGTNLQLTRMPVVGVSKQRIVLYKLKENNRVVYVHTNADATDIRVSSANSILDRYKCFLNVSRFLSDPQDGLVSKNGAVFYFYDELLRMVEKQKYKEERVRQSKVVIDSSLYTEKENGSDSIDYTTNKAYIEAYVNRKKNIDVLNRNKVSEQNVKETKIMSSSLNGFDVAKQQRDMRINQLNK